MAANDPFSWSATAAISATRNTVGDPDGAATERWLDAEVSVYLDRAQQVVVRELEIALPTVWTIDTIVLDQNNYAMPDNFDADKVVEYQNTTSDIRRLAYVTFDQYQNWFANNPIVSGEPTHYTFWRKLGTADENIVQREIIFYPTPTQTEVDAGPIRVYGYKRPEAIDTNNLDHIIELEAPYVEAMVMYAAYLMMRDDQDHTSADRLRREYDRQIQSCLDHQSRKSRARIPQLEPRDSVLRPWKYTRNPFARRGFGGY
jgi:hypothetical protein